MDEIKMALCAGKNIDDKVWSTIIGEVDLNGDGDINLEEFRHIMEAIFDIVPG
jgi:Ca2+-binding EF-hand superfamily protein